MIKNVIGIGSAFLTLIFVAVCLAIFALISHTSAGNEMALAKAEAELVKGYYEADALASRIAAELVSAETIPESLYGTTIYHARDEDPVERKVEFSLPMSQTRELYVILTLKADTYDIRTWQIRDINQWQPDTSLPVRRP